MTSIELTNGTLIRENFACEPPASVAGHRQPWGVAAWPVRTARARSHAVPRALLVLPLSRAAVLQGRRRKETSK